MEKALNMANHCGLDPQKDDRFSLLKRAVSIVPVLFVLVSAVSEFISNMDKAEVYERSAECFVPESQTIFKFTSMIIFKNEINILIDKLKHFWKIDQFGAFHEKKFQQQQKYVDMFFNLYSFLMYNSCVLYTLISYFLLPRRTIFLCYGAINGNFQPSYYTINYIVEIVTFYVIATVVIAYDTIFFYFAWYIYTDFKLLRIAFQKWNKQKVISDKTQFTEAIKHHDFVLNFVKNLNKVFSPIFLLQYFSNLIAICFLLFMITRDGIPPPFHNFLQFLPAMLAFLLQSFTFCMIGNLIINLSVDITEVIFYADWMRDDVYENKTARLIILNRALIPAKLTVGKFANLDLRTFILILRNAYSFLAFVNNFLN